MRWKKNDEVFLSVLSANLYIENLKSYDELDQL